MAVSASGGHLSGKLGEGLGNQAKGGDNIPSILRKNLLSDEEIATTAPFSIPLRFVSMGLNAALAGVGTDIGSSFLHASHLS
jgi:hypothetical protein